MNNPEDSEIDRRFASEDTAQLLECCGWLIRQQHRRRESYCTFKSLLQVRSSKQDQIHNSIVSTLLALMDGLTSRGQVGMAPVSASAGDENPGYLFVASEH